MPAGHVVLPFDARGRCPLLDEAGRCTIYAHRPRTCRTYDCRVFAAAGIDADREEITARARRWRFACPTAEDAQHLAAVAAAARWIPAHAAAFPGGEVPDDPAQLAVLAVRVADVFLPGGPAASAARRRRHRRGRRRGGRVTAYAFVTAEPLPPIAFGAWLEATLATLHDDVPADVPCGACNACCRTFHQLHIRPGEKRARKRLPKEYLSVRRGLPPGYLLLGYTEDGACPVLVEGPVHHLRGPAARVPHLRLPAVRGHGRRAGPRRDRGEGAALALLLSGAGGPRAAGGGARGRPLHPGDAGVPARRGGAAAAHPPRHAGGRHARALPARRHRGHDGGARSPTATGSSPSPTPTRTCSATADACASFVRRRRAVA